MRVRVNDGTVDADSGATTLTITNVAPNGTFGNGGSVGEGGTGQVSFSAVTDPSSADAAGVRYAMTSTTTARTRSGQDVRHGDHVHVGHRARVVPRRRPATRIVRGALFDKDGGARSLTTSITVTNAAPTGTHANQTVAEGTTATVGLTGVTDASAGDVAAGLRYAYDFQADGTWEIGSTTYAQASTATTADAPPRLRPTARPCAACASRSSTATATSARTPRRSRSPTATRPGRRPT